MIDYIHEYERSKPKQHPELASSGYCLANPEEAGAEYLVYLPEGGPVTVDLSGTPGKLVLEWFDPAWGVVTDSWSLQRGATDEVFAAPFQGDAVLYLRQADHE